jgi:hypothetical protein
MSTDRLIEPQVTSEKSHQIINTETKVDFHVTGSIPSLHTRKTPDSPKLAIQPFPGKVKKDRLLTVDQSFSSGNQDSDKLTMRFLGKTPPINKRGKGVTQTISRITGGMSKKICRTEKEDTPGIW